MKRMIDLFWLCLLMANSIHPTVAQAPAPARCKVGSEAAPVGFWAWAPRTEIKVYVVQSNFKPNELSSLLLPFTNFNAVSEVTGSLVKFIFQGFTAGPVHCQNCLTLTRGRVYDKAKRHGTELRAYSAQDDEIMTWAIIVVDETITDEKVLSNVIAHELGHNFGLLDCYDCKSKSTVMLKLKRFDSPNDMVGPTECDIVQIRSAYSRKIARLPHASLKRTSKPQTEDEGEDAVEDDTPVVVRKP